MRFAFAYAALVTLTLATASPAEAGPLSVPLPAMACQTYVGDAELLLDNAEIYPAIRGMVAGARRSVAVDYYVLGGPQADAFADQLIARQAEGVAVRVLLDADMGILPALTALTRPVLTRLRAGGVPVRFYPKSALNQRNGQVRSEDHNKAVVVDGVEAVVTSMNFGADLLLSHEVGLHVTGHAAHALGRDILSAFALAAPLGPEHARPWPAAVLASGRGDSQVGYVPTGLSGRTARARVIQAIQGARMNVDVMMAQLEDHAAIDALIAAHREGVAVRVLMDPNEISRLSPLGWAPHGVYNLQAAVRLAAAGIPVRWYHPPAGEHALHAKSALVDGQRLMVGSTNWNVMSFDMNNEAMLTVEGGAAPERFATTFERDWHGRGTQFQADAWPLLGPRLWAYGGLAWLLN